MNFSILTPASAIREYRFWGVCVGGGGGVFKTWVAYSRHRASILTQDSFHFFLLCGPPNQ